MVRQERAEIDRGVGHVCFGIPAENWTGRARWRCRAVPKAWVAAAARSWAGATRSRPRRCSPLGTWSSGGRQDHFSVISCLALLSVASRRQAPL